LDFLLRVIPQLFIKRTVSFNTSTSVYLQNSAGVPRPPISILGVPVYGHPSDPDHQAAGSAAAGRSLHCLEMNVCMTELHCLNLHEKRNLNQFTATLCNLLTQSNKYKGQQQK
jgi:hypothetical protein